MPWFRLRSKLGRSSVNAEAHTVSALTIPPAGSDRARLDSPPPSPGSWRRRISWLSGLLVLAAVIAVALHLTELERFIELARNAHPAWLLAGLLLQSATYFAAAGAWWVILRRRGQHLSYLGLVPMGLAKLFTDQALPSGGISGTLLVIRALARRRVPSEIAMSTLLIGMSSYYVAYALAVAMTIGLLHFEGLLDGRMLAAAVGFACIAVSLPVLVFALRRHTHRWPFTIAARIPMLAALLEAMREARLRPREDWLSFFISTILQLGVFILDAATLWTTLRAVGSAASPVAAFVAFISASVAATVGPMPLGLGTFEAAAVATLHLQGQALAVALTATLLLRGMTFWLPMLPGLILARRELIGSASGRWTIPRQPSAP